MSCHLDALAVGAHDPAALARFWAGLLGRDAVEGPGGVDVPPGEVLPRLAADAGLVDAADTAALRAGWTLAAEVRNALTLVRGRPTDQLPRHGPELTGVVQLLGAHDPQEFVDEYLRTTRRARAATERVLES